MVQRTLGRSGLLCPGWDWDAWGCRVLRTGDERESIRTIHRALELGMNFLDTADIYGLGRNEELVGKAIRDRRRKWSLRRSSETCGKDGSWLGVNGSPGYVRACCEDSLRRLGVDTIDLYYQHRVDPDTPSRTRSAPWPISSGRGRCVTSGCPKQRPRRSAGRARFTRSRHCRRNTPSGRGIRRRKCFRPAGSWGSVSWRTVRWQGIFGGRIKSLNDLSEGDYRRNNPRFARGTFPPTCPSWNISKRSRPEEMPPRTGCPGLAARPGGGRVSDPGNQAGGAPGGKRRSNGGGADFGRSRANRRRCSPPERPGENVTPSRR